ncbi:MAG: tRNA threonylcarbamoyladenosine dehydratase [Bacillota bacterium]
MENIFNRTKLLIGNEGLEKLQKAKVAVLGVGGVGSFTVEALVRAGIGKITLIDHDIVDITNINRQLHALVSTVGKVKVELMRERIFQINPQAEVNAVREFITPENIKELLEGQYNYIVDAIDNITGKLAIIQFAKEKDIPVISSMGAANKLSNKNFQVVDISETRVCPLAKVIRKELKNKGIPSGVKVVYSPDPIIKPDKFQLENTSGKREMPGSISFVPPVAGLLLAGEVVNDILNNI